MTSVKPYHYTYGLRIGYNPTQIKGWTCVDRKTGAVGWGLTPEQALVECIIDLEMDTSDIHK